MAKENHVVNWLTEELFDSLESVPGQPLIEIVGGNRVLIENHRGILDYSMHKILVNVKFGHVRICGDAMEIVKMTKEQLVICGEVYSVSFCRGNGL